MSIARITRVALITLLGSAVPVYAQGVRVTPDTGASPMRVRSVTIDDDVRLGFSGGTRHAGVLRDLTAATVGVEVKPPFPFRNWGFPRTRISAGRDSLTMVETLQGPRWRSGALATGLLAGAALGAWLGARSVHRECDRSTPGCVVGSRGQASILGGVIGAAAGHGVARLIARKRWVPAQLPDIAGQ